MSSYILPPQHPDPSLPAPSPPAPLSEAQQTSLSNLIAHFSSPTFKIPIPTTPPPEGCNPVTYTESLTEFEEFWLSEEQILRFLRATKGDEAAGKKRLEDTLAWRRSFGLDAFTPEYISPENETGKQLAHGFDKERRPTWYMRPALQNTEQSPRQVHHVFYTMRLIEASMPRGVEKLALLINFAERGRSPSLSTSKQVLFILQDHYPERLGTAFVVNLPFLVRGFFTLISPFLDPVTRTKLNLPSSTNLTAYVPASQLDTSFQGEVAFPKYTPEEHELYWRSERGIVSLARERERRGLENWRKLPLVNGTSRVGRREWDYKEGEETWGVGFEEEDKAGGEMEEEEVDASREEFESEKQSALTASA